jgi:hypothetical protein
MGYCAANSAGKSKSGVESNTAEFLGRICRDFLDHPIDLG